MRLFWPLTLVACAVMAALTVAALQALTGPTYAVSALTRFDALPGGALASIPFGPTAPEMVAIMGALGCRHAVMLDGGLSGQLLLRAADGQTHSWRGWRKVPVGMIAERRCEVRGSGCE